MTAKRGSPEFAEFRQNVKDLVEWGFKGVIVELCEGLDAYNRPIVIEVASLWGIDSLENGYLNAIVTDLVSEMMAN